MDNPEILATLGTQVTQDKDNQEWTTQRYWQHCVHKTQDKG